MFHGWPSRAIRPGLGQLSANCTRFVEATSGNYQFAPGHLTLAHLVSLLETIALVSSSSIVTSVKSQLHLLFSYLKRPLFSNTEKFKHCSI